MYVCVLQGTHDLTCSVSHVGWMILQVLCVFVFVWRQTHDFTFRACHAWKAWCQKWCGCLGVWVCATHYINFSLEIWVTRHVMHDCYIIRAGCPAVVWWSWQLVMAALCSPWNCVSHVACLVPKACSQAPQQSARSPACLLTWHWSGSMLPLLQSNCPMGASYLARWVCFLFPCRKVADVLAR